MSMDSTPQSIEKRIRRFPRRLLRWLAVLLLAAGVAYLGTWLAERSLHSPRKKRAMQSWLEGIFNADVSPVGDMTMRLNLVRHSRLVFRDVEVEHSNVLFPGKLAVIRRMEARALPWSVLGIWPGRLELSFQNPQISLEESESGEWNTQGLMRPLKPPELAFPFPIPRISDWHAEVEEGQLLLRRRGYELNLALDGEITGRPGSDQVTVRTQKSPFSLGRVGEDAASAGSVGPATLRLALGKAGDLPLPVPGQCRISVDKLPMSSLPFVVSGIPLADVSGAFTGLVSYQTSPGAAGAIALEGELLDVPLAVFGLPRNAPLRMTWPVSPARDDCKAQLRMGPSGFGAFEIEVPLDNSGRPRLLSMRGDVAALDDVPAIFTRYSRWPNWLSRTFPAIEWRSGKWLGFGWNGTNMRLSLTRHTAGLSLSGEAEMMNGRVRIALNPDQPDTPITLAAEKLDPQLLAVKMSQMLPEAFRVHLTGAGANLTWMGSHEGDGAIGEWGLGMVLAKPMIDVSASGAWWKGIRDITRAVAGALPEWGGGDASELERIAETAVFDFDQLSIVSEKDEGGVITVEFRVYGDAFGQATGVLVRSSDGVIEGEFLLAGPSRVLDAVEDANPEFGLALKLLAHDSLGMRVGFRAEADGEPEFFHSFLRDAKLVHENLLREAEKLP